MQRLTVRSPLSQQQFFSDLETGMEIYSFLSEFWRFTWFSFMFDFLMFSFQFSWGFRSLYELINFWFFWLLQVKRNFFLIIFVRIVIMSSLSRELVFLILQFLEEEKFKETVHRYVILHFIYFSIFFCGSFLVIVIWIWWKFVLLIFSWFVSIFLWVETGARVRVLL